MESEPFNINPSVEREIIISELNVRIHNQEFTEEEAANLLQIYDLLTLNGPISLN